MLVSKVAVRTAAWAARGSWFGRAGNVDSPVWRHWRHCHKISRQPPVVLWMGLALLVRVSSFCLILELGSRFLRCFRFCAKGVLKRASHPAGRLSIESWLYLIQDTHTTQLAASSMPRPMSTRASRYTCAASRSPWPNEHESGQAVLETMHMSSCRMVTQRVRKRRSIHS